MKTVFLTLLTCLALFASAQCPIGEDDTSPTSITQEPFYLVTSLGDTIPNWNFPTVGLPDVQETGYQSNADYTYFRTVMPDTESIVPIKPIAQYYHRAVKPIYMSVSLHKSGSMHYGNVLTLSGSKLTQMPYTIQTTGYGSSYLAITQYGKQ